VRFQRAGTHRYRLLRLKAVGVCAVSDAGGQVPVKADDARTEARITWIDDARMLCEPVTGRA
jgi:hypothetical protein